MFCLTFAPEHEGEEEEEDELAALARDSETSIEELLKNRYQIPEGEEEDEEGDEGEDEAEEDDEEEATDAKPKEGMHKRGRKKTSAICLCTHSRTATNKRKAEDEAPATNTKTTRTG